MKKILTLAVTIFLLSGCTTYWKHPQGRDLNSDVASCERQATKNVCNTSTASSSTTCQPNYLGGQNCGTSYYPATTTCRDQVDYTERKNCLIRLGWKETDKDGNYKY